jgi:hypothetical protein
MDEKINPSVTSDIWSTRQGYSFISFTMHIINPEFELLNLSLGAIPFTEAPSHTANAIAVKLKAIIDDTLTCPEMVPVITTDCAANMRKAVRDGGYYWIKCALHCLHNSVKAGLNAIEEESHIVEKVKNFVTLIHKSPKQAEIFREC